MDYGANVNAVDRMSTTPLLFAAHNGHVFVTKASTTSVLFFEIDPIW